jgi:hypothetical protein
LEEIAPSSTAQIANEIPTAGGSLGLHADMRLTGPPTRPDVFFRASQHQFYIEQARGMNENGASQYSALFA